MKLVAKYMCCTYKDVNCRALLSTKISRATFEYPQNYLSTILSEQIFAQRATV
jgi:hypothetical protein